MQTQGFDALTRALGRATSRRDVVRVLGASAAATFLGGFGISCRNRCSTGSKCGERVYCNKDETCICITSAEGKLRCTQLPRGCNLQKCTTSADCSNLGKDWICDSPGSGCCSATQQYCMAPCGTEYDPKQYRQEPPQPKAQQQQPVQDTTRAQARDEPREPEAPEPEGLHVAASNDRDVLFFSGGDEQAVYYYGPAPQRGMEVHYVVFRGYDGRRAVLIVNEDYLPIQWMLPGGTISVRRRDTNKPLDPKEAFHFFASDKQESKTLDITPSDLRQLVTRTEQATGTTLTATRSFVSGTADTWDKLLRLAKTPGANQPRMIAAAIGFGAAAAAAAMDEALEQAIADAAGDSDAALNLNLAGAAPIRTGVRLLTALSGRSRGASSNALAMNLASLVPAAKDSANAALGRALEPPFGPKGPQGPNDPGLDVLLCQGATRTPPFCHYMFFVGRSPFPCVDVCRTDLGCYTNICMPMSLGLDDAKNVRGR